MFRKMNSIWTSTSINGNLKIRLYNAILLPTVLYSSEAWKSTVSLNKKLDVFHQRCLRKILKISYRDHITNEEVLRRAKSKTLHETVITSRIKLAGHILRLPAEHHPNTGMTRVPSGGKRNRGRPRITRRSTLRKDLQIEGVDWNSIEVEAAGRVRWRKFADQCPALGRRNNFFIA